jgi:hypothetical protein
VSKPDFDKMTKAEAFAYMELGLECVKIMVPAIHAMREKGATTERIIRELELVIEELRNPTPQELANAEFMMKIAEAFRKEGVLVVDHDTSGLPYIEPSRH